jgi:hypothetical protein
MQICDLLAVIERHASEIPNNNHTLAAMRMIPATGAIWRPKEVTFSKEMNSARSADPKDIHHAADEQQRHSTQQQSTHTRHSEARA